MTGKITRLLALMLGLASFAMAQDAKTALNNAVKTMGDVKSIEFSGTGHSNSLGQAYTPHSPWPITNVTSYTRTIDYGSRASKEEYVHVEPVPPVQGGGAPFGGEQKVVSLVSGQYAWNQAGAAAQPAVAAAEERQLQIWLTPHGFLKGALENNATERRGKDGAIVSFMAGRFKVNGAIDAQGMVTRTETWLPHPVLGDMLVETTFTGYKDFGGVKFPTMIVQKQGGEVVMDLAVTSVKANVALDLPVPDAVKSATLPPVVVKSEKLGDGVWFLGGGTHNSVLVEYPKYLVMIEGPNDDARSLGVMAEAKKLAPGKTIQYLVNTHHHFDHSGGVRAYVAAGATIITADVNKPFYEQAWKAPRTLGPDELSKNPKKAAFITVKDKYVLADGDRSIQIYRTPGDNHNIGLMFVYIPGAKVLVEADDFTPLPAGVPVAPRSRGFTVNLYKQLQSKNLDIVTVAPLHGFVVPFTALVKVANGD